MTQHTFPLVEEYLSIRLGLDVSATAPGVPALVETPKRLRREPSCGYVRCFWWLRFEDGRVAVSTPPGTGPRVMEILDGVRSEEVQTREVVERLRVPVDAALCGASLPDTDRYFAYAGFACNPSLLRRHAHGECRRLADETVPAAEGLKLPTQCFPDGIAYGVVEDGCAVSIAFAHAYGVMTDRVVDLGIETAAAYRRRGYAKTAVSAVVGHVAGNGGEGRYVCRPDNAESLATARSVGFVPHSRSLVLAAPHPARHAGADEPV